MDVSYDGIIGLNFLNLYDTELDARTGQLAIQEPAPQSIQCKLLPVGAPVRVVGTVVIPPRTVGHLSLASIGATTGTNNLVEPNDQILQELGLLGYRTLAGEQLLLPVCNLSDDDVRVDDGVEIGTLASADVLAQPEPSVGSSRTVVELPQTLADLLAKSALTEEEDKEQAQTLLSRYADVFAMPGEPLGRTDHVRHGIDTADHPPIRQPYRRIPLAKKDMAEKEIKTMLDQGIVSPSESPWASPVVLVRKKDGGCRFCID